MITIEKYFKVLEKYRISVKEIDETRLNFHLPFLKQLNAIDNSSVSLIDMTSLEYLYIPENLKYFKTLRDKDREGEIGLLFFLKRMNPYDRSMFFDTSLKCFEYLYKQPIDERKNYKTCQDFRIRDQKGCWIRLLQQIIVLELDNAGDIWLVLIINDLSPLKDNDVPLRRYMEYIPNGSRVLFPSAESQVESPISPRELEILGLIARGYGSQDIADYLGISIATVNNHRQHILSKLDVTNSAEAINYSLSIGIL